MTSLKTHYTRSCLCYNSEMSRELLDNYQAWVFDTDGTTANTSEALETFLKRFLKRFCENPNLNFSKDDINKWNYFRDALIKNGLDDLDAERIEKKGWNRVWVLKNAKRMDGTYELMDLLKSHGKNIFSATSRPNIEKVHQTTRQWIQENLPQVSKVFMNPSDSGKDGPALKASVLIMAAQIYGSAVLVEDFPGHVEKILELLEISGKNLDIHFILVPYAKLPVSEELARNPHVTVIHRGMNQSIKPVQEYLMDSVAHS